MGNDTLISIKPPLKMAKTLKEISALTMSQRQLLHFLKGLLFLANEFVCKGNRDCVLSQGQFTLLSQVNY